MAILSKVALGKEAPCGRLIRQKRPRPEDVMKERHHASPDLPYSRLWCEKEKRKTNLPSLSDCYFGFLLFPAEDIQNLQNK